MFLMPGTVAAVKPAGTPQTLCIVATQLHVPDTSRQSCAPNREQLSDTDLTGSGYSITVKVRVRR
jgi:hypothetical protein